MRAITDTKLNVSASVTDHVEHAVRWKVRYTSIEDVRSLDAILWVQVYIPIFRAALDDVKKL